MTELEQLKSFERFGLDTKAAKAAVVARDEIQTRLDETRRALGALRPGAGGDFIAESSRLSNLLAGLDLALQGAERDIKAALEALKLKALEAPHLAKLSDKIKASDVEIIDQLLVMPDMLHARLMLSNEFVELINLLGVWRQELGMGETGWPYHNLPGGVRQHDVNVAVNYFLERFALLCGGGRPQPGDPPQAKLEWFCKRIR